MGQGSDQHVVPCGHLGTREQKVERHTRIGRLPVGVYALR